MAKVFDRPARLRAVRTNRSEADIPDPPLTLSLLLAAWLRRPSLPRLQTDTARRGWQRSIGWAGRISDDAFAYALARYRLDDLRGALVGGNQRLKQNQQFERAKIQGLLVVAADANEQFHSRCRCGPQCSQRIVTEYYHRQVYAHLDAPDFSTVLEVEPVRPGEEGRRRRCGCGGGSGGAANAIWLRYPTIGRIPVYCSPWGGKSETRNPKSEGNPKSEMWPRLNPLGWPAWAAGRIAAKFADLPDSLAQIRSRRQRFGFRISDFLRISDFEFRICPRGLQ